MHKDLAFRVETLSIKTIFSFKYESLGLWTQGIKSWKKKVVKLLDVARFLDQMRLFWHVEGRDATGQGSQCSWALTIEFLTNLTVVQIWLVLSYRLKLDLFFV